MSSASKFGMHERISAELRDSPFYRLFPNAGQAFVAWYLRRVLLLDETETKASITDGQLDKQIDAIVVDDTERRVRVVQGKFIRPEAIDAEPLREVLAAWVRLRDLPTLQLQCSGRLAERLEALRAAREDDYDIGFELLTTGFLTPAAQTDLEAFRQQMGEDSDFEATLALVDSATLEAQLADAEQRDLPELATTISLDSTRCLVTKESGVRVVLAMLPIKECIRLPGIQDGKLFRRNVRQSLGLSNKVNKALRGTLASREKARYFFFFHNGITALCKSFTPSTDGTRLQINDLSVVNGCQSLSTMYATSGRILEHGLGSVLVRIYEIPQRDLADEISVNTNSQSAVKPRDLRSNDKYMLSIKRRYEAAVPDGYFVTKRGENIPATAKPEKCLEAPDYARMVITWMCQRPNLASNEKRLFDEHYKTIFHSELAAPSILALRLWLHQIDMHWPRLSMIDAVKAVRGSARFHVLFVVSQLFAHTSEQQDKVPLPAETLDALKFAPVILGQASTCINQAVRQAQTSAGNRIFSPQNWLKSKSALSDEQLVAAAVVNVLKGMPTPELRPMIDSLTIKPEHFSFRWSAD